MVVPFAGSPTALQDSMCVRRGGGGGCEREGEGRWEKDLRREDVRAESGGVGDGGWGVGRGRCL